MTNKAVIKIDIYDCSVVLITTDEIVKCINEHLKENDDGEMDQEVFGYSYSPSKDLDFYYMFIASNSINHNTINHEKSHIIDFIFKDRKIKNKGEVRAFFDGYLSSQIYGALRLWGMEVK